MLRIANRSPSLLTMTSVEEKVHEEFARQKSVSRNQDPANPIPSNSGCHNTKAGRGEPKYECPEKKNSLRAAQRDHGVNSSGALRWNVTGEQPDQQKQQ